MTFEAKIIQIEKELAGLKASLKSGSAGGVPTEAEKEEAIRKLNKVRDFILWFNSNCYLENDERPKQGEKENTQLELRLFNDMPQIVMFYGKTAYRFNVKGRDKPNSWEAARRCYGYEAFSRMPEEIIRKHFQADQITARKSQLKDRGV